MKLISLDSLEPGKMLGRPIYNEKGTLLLGSGVAISARYLRRLKEMGYTSVYIHEKGYEDIEVKDVISDQTRREAVSMISETFDAVRQSESSKRVMLDKARITGIADKIVDDLTGNADQFLDLIDLKSFDNYSFLHSVNVSVLTVLTAAHSGKFTGLELRDLAMGALLFDIGKSHIPLEVVQKKGRLSAEEFRIMKTHTQIGFEILQHKSNVKPLVASVALQHQEYYNGSGYPNGLSGEQIHIFSRIPPWPMFTIHSPPTAAISAVCPPMWAWTTFSLEAAPILTPTGFVISCAIGGALPGSQHGGAQQRRDRGGGGQQSRPDRPPAGAGARRPGWPPVGQAGGAGPGPSPGVPDPERPDLAPALVPIRQSTV